MYFCFSQSYGQSYFTTKGTDFWLGFMQNYLVGGGGTDRMKVYITADNMDASGIISVPLGGWTQNYTVKANSTTEIIIPTSVVMCTESETIENRGIHVTSDIPVSVYQLNYVKYTSDAAIIFPTSSLGTQYRAMTYSATDGAFETSELLVVAAYDGTVIKITPKCATVGPGGTQGHAANQSFNITLNKGEVYQVQGNYTAPLDLTGTMIELDTTASDNCKKFAVFSGNLCARVPDGGTVCCCNTLCEEMMPIKTWGTKYITVPLKTRVTDLFRITASKNGTIVTWDGSAPIGLNAGEFYEYSSGTATYVESNKPISVAQFSESSTADGNVNSDPFLIMLQPLDQSLGEIVFNSFSSSVISNYYLNLVTRTKYTGLLTLDGKTIPPAAFIPVTFNPAYSYARLDLLQGNHSLKSDSGYTANIYGFGSYESYGYIAGATFIDPVTGYNVITPTATIKYYNFTDTICKGSPLSFEAFTNPLITNYFWKFGDGSPVVNNNKVSHTYNYAGKYTLTFYFQKKGICGLDSIVWNIHIKCCNPLPGITATTPVCTGNNSSIKDTSTFNPTAKYKWRFDGGNVISGSGQGPYNVNWLVKGKDTVWVIVADSSCISDSAYFVITVNPIPTSTFNLTTPICAKKSSVINYTGNASPTAIFNWNFNGGIIISGNGSGPYNVKWLNAGKFKVTLNVSEGGCFSDTSATLITVNPLPIPAFTADPQTTTSDKPLITFNDFSTNTINWSWNFGEPSSGTNNVSSSESPTHSYAGDGTFTVWLVTESKDGCSDSISSVVNISELNSFYVPNAFIPDFDNNKFFQPYGADISYFVLNIFDRWGELIFKSETKSQPWDGNFNGKKAEPGVYVWYIKYFNNKGLSKKAWGRVTLIR